MATAHLSGEIRERVRVWGVGTRHQPGLCSKSPPQEAAHSIPVVWRTRATVWGAGAWILLGSGSTRPHPRAGSHQPHPAPSLGGPLAPRRDDSAGMGGGKGGGAGTHLAREPGKGLGDERGRQAPPPTWVWTPRGARSPASLLRLPGRRPGCPKTLSWTKWCFTAIC